jgi:3-oxoacyl-[acyl-carrier protein] reductase
VEIEGKVALVTGAAKRVGRAIALALAERGAELVIHYRDSEHEAQEVLALTKKAGGKPVAVRGDVSVAADVDRIVETAMQAFGRIEILVNNAAIFYRTPFEKLTEEDWDRFLDVNLKGPFLLCRKVGEIMRRQARGKIINLADIAGTKVWAEYIPYSVSKAGLIALTRAIALELGPFGIRCNAICPGAIRTSMLLGPEPPGSELERQISARTPLGRIGEPEEIARVALFLASSLSEFVTGEHLLATGGYTM